MRKNPFIPTNGRSSRLCREISRRGRGMPLSDTIWPRIHESNPSCLCGKKVNHRERKIHKGYLPTVTEKHFVPLVASVVKK